MFGRIPGGAWRAMTPRALEVDKKAAPAAARGASRTLTGLASLEALPERLLRVPIFPAGKTGLKRLGIAPHKLLTRPDAFQESVAQLNRELGSDPGRLARSGLNQQEILSVALGVLQGAHRLKQDIETPEVLSLQYHLLSSPSLMSLPLAALELHAQQVLDQVAADWIGQSAGGSWWDLSPVERERQVTDLVSRVPFLPRSMGQAADAAGAMRLSFGPIPPLCAMMTPLEGRGIGLLSLSEAVVSGKPSQYASLALYLLPAHIAHEKVHLGQYAILDRLWAPGPQEPQDLSAAVCDGLSIGLQESLRALGRFDGLLPSLPHERLAWSLAALIHRAAVRHPAVPRPAAAEITEYLINTYGHYGHLMGDRSVPQPLAPDGVLRADDVPELVSPGLSRTDIAQRVDDFLKGPLPARG